MSKRSFTRTPYRVKVKCEKDLSQKEVWEAVIWMYTRDPEMFMRAVTILNAQNGEVDCPYPHLCTLFPCATLICDAKGIDPDGHPVYL